MNQSLEHLEKQTQLPMELQEIQKTIALKTNIDSTDILSNFAPFFYELAEIKKHYSAINFENPNPDDAESADILRKKIAKVRIASEKTKDELSKEYVLVHKMITSANTVLNAACKLDENNLNNVVKHLEIQEQKRLAQLLIERRELLTPYGFNADDVNGLEKMSDDIWNAFLMGAKKQHDDRIEADKKAESDRLEKEKEEEEKMQFVLKENEKLREQAKAAEAKAAEEKKRVAEEKKAAKAPDKTKLFALMNEIKFPHEIILKTEDGQNVFEDILQKFSGFKTWANQQIETL